MGIKSIYDSTLTAIADAIRAKDGSSGTYTPLEMPQAIEDIPTGGGLEEKDVNFYDYDGTLLYSYTAAEFANITEMPENPTHEGLTSQGWNWDLSDAKSYVANWGRLIIGQSYITDDGATRIYVDLDEYSLEPYLCININGSATIDWGDGSEEDTVTNNNANSRNYVQHSYAEPGSYVIKINPIENTPLIIPSSLNSQVYNSNLLLYANNTTSVDTRYSMAIKKIEIGKNFCWNSGNYGSFANLQNLETITIPADNYVNTVNNHTLQRHFLECKKLKCLILPRGILSFKDFAFAVCTNLEIVSIPQTVTGFTGSNVFSNNSNLKEITVPEFSATNFNQNYPFQNCYSLKRAIVPSYPNGCFQNCQSLEKVVLTDADNARILSGAFSTCYSLKEFDMPTTALDTNIPSQTLTYNNYIEHLKFPDGFKTVVASAMSNLRGLKTLTLPPTITSINAGGLSNYFSLREFHIMATTPPTLSGAISNFPTTCKIYVPEGSLSAYQTATNWSTYASQMEEE